MTRLPPRFTLFPYTTLFRSAKRRPGRRKKDALHSTRFRHHTIAAAAAGAVETLRSPRVLRGHQRGDRPRGRHRRSEEHTSELQLPDHLVCRLLLEKKTIISS